jgi:two-component system response regulator FixJ
MGEVSQRSLDRTPRRGDHAGMDAKPLVYIVEDDSSVRHSLRLLLKAAGFDSVAFDSAEAFLDGWQPHNPSCIVVDVRMPGMSGLELQRLLPERGIDAPVIVMTGHGDIAMAVDALKAGAADFIEKPCDEDRLLSAIREAIAKAEKNAGRVAELSDLRRRLAGLTEREREVMDLVAAGHQNKVIGLRLGISDRTVEVHKGRIMQKMEAHTSSELIRMVLTLEQGA